MSIGTLMNRHLPELAAMAMLAVALAATPADALIVRTWDGVGTPALANTTPPPDDPGWANLPSNRTGIYLGEGLLLTAIHAEALGTVEIAGGSFPVIPGSAVSLTNPSTFGSRRQSSGTLDATSDLRIYRIGVDTATGLSPEDLDPAIRRISLGSRQPNTSTETLTMFGLGANRILNAANTTNGQFFFNSSGGVITDPAQWGSSSFRGFQFTLPPGASTRQWQWGQNFRTTLSGGAFQSGSNILMEGAIFADTIGYQLRFDEFGLDNEAQGAAGDSGGPVFWKDGKGTASTADDEWVLAGLMHGVYPTNGNNALIGAFTSFTAISDLSLSHYRNQIEGARGRFSLLGDADLDGIVTGSIVGGAATGDLAAIVDNWMLDSGEADIHSWMRGDFNQDGLTDLLDFVQLRTALGGSVSTSSFALLVSGAGIPEPAAAALALLAAVSLAARRRRG